MCIHTESCGHLLYMTYCQERQAIVDSFQVGQLDVIICSYGVGATGLTLTRSHSIILLDRPWTPGDARQVSSWVYRLAGRGGEGREDTREGGYWRGRRTDCWSYVTDQRTRLMSYAIALP